MNARTRLILQLFDAKVIEFGDFTLRSGIQTPFYVDLRRVASYPHILKEICLQLWETISLSHVQFDLLCGVPYAAVSYATVIGMQQNIPTIIKRKERKEYGSKKLIEGVFEEGQNCLVLEDTITSGISLVEAVADLEGEGLSVKDIAVVIDRQQGGSKTLERLGYKVHKLFSIEEIMDVLMQNGRINYPTFRNTMLFIEQNQVKIEDVNGTTSESMPMPYHERIEEAHHPVTKRLLQIINTKESNLICSADVTTKSELLALADTVGPHICCLKTHIDSINDFDTDLIEKLQQLAKKHQFLLFEDRKFGDIGSTLQKQYTSTHYAIHQWADLITVHVVGGAASIQALKDTGHFTNKGMVIIAQMSTKDTLTDSNYVKNATKIAEEHKDVVVGIVAQERLTNDLGILQFTPGIHLDVKSDQAGQVYNSPNVAFAERGTDVMIVGRGIYQADNPLEAAKTYQKAGWEAYNSNITVNF
ncbi:MAG: orotidine-5'-phosphate decarboxylase [Chitinophagales bacterium]